MSPRQYADTQLAIARISEIVCQLPLTEFIAAINTAETYGPMLDPKLYREGGEQMAKVKEQAETLLRCKDVRLAYKRNTPEEINHVNEMGATMALAIIMGRSITNE